MSPWNQCCRGTMGLMEMLNMSRKERNCLAVMGQVKHKKLSLREAADVMVLSYRQAKRVWRRYQDKGDAGLVQGLRGRPSARRTAAARFPGLPPVQPTGGHFHPCDHPAGMLDQHRWQPHHLPQQGRHRPALAFVRQVKDLHGFDQVVGQGGDGVEHPIGRQAFAGRMVQVQAAQDFLEQLSLPTLSRCRAMMASASVRPSSWVTKA